MNNIADLLNGARVKIINLVFACIFVSINETLRVTYNNNNEYNFSLFTSFEMLKV